MGCPEIIFILRLESYVHRAEETKRYGLAAQLLKQAAEEMGGAYTSRREITGKDGVPVGPAVVVYIPDNGREEPEGVQRGGMRGVKSGGVAGGIDTGAQLADGNGREKLMEQRQGLDSGRPR